MQIPEYCREIETYLCRKNDGHLIRVVGPSFELVSGWAAQGVPLKVAFEGIDRCFERYHRKGPRRRPLKIDFCDADVLDVFDEWRRAVGLQSEASESGSSLPAHLERVVLRLTAARANGRVGAAFDDVIDRAARELDAARSEARGVRGDRRRALLDRLAMLDDELLKAARAALDQPTRAALESEADAELSTFRERLTVDAYERARGRAVDRLVREHLGLPTLVFE